MLSKHNKKTELVLEVPDICQCGFNNFYYWGTKMNGKIHIEVSCMRCGKKNSIVEQ